MFQVSELLKDARVTLTGEQAAALARDVHRLRKVLTAISPHKASTPDSMAIMHALTRHWHAQHIACLTVELQVQGERAAGFIRDLGLSPAVRTIFLRLF
jgi:cytosine/adenosine deaminase-related metal-dependent hydrolase